jgi:acetyl-CoA C-acetyltransferase
MDAFALASHQKGAAATAAGHFKREVLVVNGVDKEGNVVEHSGERAGEWVGWVSERGG